MATLRDFLESKTGRRQSHAQWARDLNLAPSYIAHLLAGNRKPSLTVAYQLENITDGMVTMRSWLEPADGDTL
jgi:hypothetical protein